MGWRWSWLVLLLELMCLGLVPAARGFELFRGPGGIPSVISPAITAQPIEVLLWVRDTVTPDDEAWITGEIRNALDLWEQVPTTNLRFTTKAIRSAARPAIPPEDLLVVVANFADLTTGGSFPPFGGLPGTWAGAPANWRESCLGPCSPFVLVAAHEIGHTLGLLHTTISDIAFGSTVPIPLMYFAIRPTMQMTTDDIAAISTAYPNPRQPLESVTGAIRGVCVLPLEAPHPFSRDGQQCQATVERTVSAAGLGIARCLSRCEIDRRRNASRICTSDAYDRQTKDCITRTLGRSAGRIRRACTTASDQCPMCFDQQNNCDPDLGFQGWVDAQIGRPLEAEQRRVELLHSRLFCQDVLPPGAGAPCSERAEIATEHAIGQIRACYLACNQRLQVGRLPSGAECFRGYSSLDPTTARCVTTALSTAREHLQCQLPPCLGIDLVKAIEDAGTAYNATLFCNAPAPKTINGVNVVAVNRVSGAPAVARLTGASQVNGEFELVGLPPGSYDVHFLGGESFAGSYPGLSPSAIQTNNFRPFQMGPYPVAAGDVHELAKVQVPIDAVSVDGIAIGSDRSMVSHVDPGEVTLPPATKGVAYEVWLHLRGGVRPISLDATAGLPPGLVAKVFALAGFVILGQGEHWIHVVGSPLVAGQFRATLELTDEQNARTILPVALAVNATPSP